MTTRHFTRRVMTTLAAVMFAASVALINPSIAMADGTGTPPPPPPGPNGAPQFVTIAYSVIYATAVL